MRAFLIAISLLYATLCIAQSTKGRGLKITYSYVSTISTPNSTSTCMYEVRDTLKAPINFKWASKQAPIKGILATNWNMTLTGYIMAPTTDNYTFYVTSDDGSRLMIADATITNDWVDHSARTTQGTITMSAGSKCKISLQYYNAWLEGSLKLEYSTPTVTRKLVPIEWLYIE